MIRRPTGYLGFDPAEPKLSQIEFIDKDIDDPNRIVLADPVFQAFRKQRALPAIRALNKSLHPIPRPTICAGIIPRESNNAVRFHTASTHNGNSTNASQLPAASMSQISKFKLGELCADATAKMTLA